MRKYTSHDVIEAGELTEFYHCSDVEALVRAAGEVVETKRAMWDSAFSGSAVSYDTLNAAIAALDAALEG